MKYDYHYLMTATSQLEIEDQGQCCIQAIDVVGQYYFLIIQTKLGKTSVLEYGPIIPDIDTLPPKLSYFYTEFDFNSKKIDSIIDKFLSKNLQEDGASLITIEEAREMIKNPIDYFSS